MRSDSLAALLALLGLAGVTGCSSISDAVTSPSRWIGDSSRALGDSSQGSADSSDAFSRSSSGDEKENEPEARYRNDVRLTAAAWAERGGSEAELSRAVGNVAERHGLLDWPTATATWRGLSVGLREGGLAEAERRRVIEALGGHDATL